MRQMSRVVMAAVLVVLLSWGSVARGFAQEATGRPFITKWQGKAGEELKIPIVGKDYKLVIKNKMGEVVDIEEKLTVERRGYYTFIPTANSVYTVEAGPEGVHYMEMSALRTDYGWYILYTSNNKLLEVVQFGTVAWVSMDHMFFQCEKMTFAANIDTPDLTKVTNMGSMFSGCSAFNQPLEHWNVSQATDMSGMFRGCSAFNQPLNDWNVSKVTDMYKMFEYCKVFNQPLEKWNVGKVTSMYEMFYGCSAFNQPLEMWNVSQVTSMNGMFRGCSAFNQPLEMWNVSQVTSMNGMFRGCSAFNQPLGEWNVSKVTNMHGMFDGCSAFNQPLNHWDVSKVTDMEYMFDDCSAFNQPLGEWKLQTSIGGLSTTAMSAVNYSLSLIGWAKQTDGASDIDFRWYTGMLIYNDAGKEAREKLIARGWKFYGDTYQPSKTVAFSLAKEGEGTLAIEGYNDEELQAIKECTELTVIAVPKDGYTLTSLTAGTQDILATKKFTVTGAVTVKAVFKKKTVAITLAKEGEGTLAIEGYNDAALQAVAEGTELTVIATPKDGYTLTSLTAGTQDILATKKFTVTGAVTVKAVFKKKTVAITLAKEGEGTLAIEGYNDAALQAVAEGTELTVIATPKDGYTLTSLTAGTQDIFATKKFTVTGAVTIKAVFKKKENNGGGNGGGSWQPQTPQAVEDAVLASLAVAPNPFSTQLRIETPEGVAARYELVNASGVVVRTGAFVATEVFVDTEALPAGLYLVRLMGQNGAKRIEKVVKY